ncbi:MAG: sensor histidine kinase [Ignavibacteria bacterium]
MKKKKADEILRKTFQELEIKVLERTAEFEKISANLKEEIRKHKTTKQKLSDTKARLSGIIHSAMDAIISINSDLNIILFNEAAEKMFKIKSDEVIGTPVSRFIPDRFKEIHSNHINNFGSTGITNRSMGNLGRVSGIRNNGDEFPIEASISQVEVSGEKIFTVILRDITDRKNYEEKIEASLKEKELLLKEIHHRVKNNLQIVSSLINLQSNFIQDKKALEVFKESQNRVKSMGLIHEKLYQSGNLSTVDIKDYVKELSEKLFSSYMHESKNINLDLKIENIFIDIDKCIAIGLILNELISNSLKHAFVNKQQGTLRISLCLADNEIALAVQDNGIGLPDNIDFRNTETLGLQLVVSLVDQLGGTIEYDGKGGAKFTVLFQVK